MQKISESFKCKPIEGMLSHQLKQFEIDGEKTIIQNPNEAQKKEHEKSTFELHEVYAIDVLISTGEGVVSITLQIKKPPSPVLLGKGGKTWCNQRDPKFESV